MHCITITLYDKKANPDQIIWITDYMTDRLFDHGFRVVNPEFRANSTTISESKEALYEFVNQLDHDTQDNIPNRYKFGYNPLKTAQSPDRRSI